MAEFQPSVPKLSHSTIDFEESGSSSSEYETPEEDFKTQDTSSDKSEPLSSSEVSISNDSEGYESPVGSSEVTLASKPTLRELRLLPVTNWYILGLELQVRQQELERIQLKYLDSKVRRTKMFGVWRRESENPSYEKLLRALIAVGRRDVAESVCHRNGFSVDVNASQPPTNCNSHSDRAVQECTHNQTPIFPDAYTSLGVSDMPVVMVILNKYAYKWNEIGLALGFTTPELRNVASKITLLPGAPCSFLEDLLNEWVQWPNEAHPIPPTLEGLESALQSQLVGLGVFSHKLKSQYQMQKRTLQQPAPVLLPDCVKEYSKFLKSKYLDAMPLMPTGEWPPNTGRQCCDLTMVERVRDSLPDQESAELRSKAMGQGQVKKVSENETIIKSLDDIVDEDSSQPLKVLMEGVPGVGKSTLVRKSCKDWADGKALQKFELVILVTLRKQEIRHAKSVEDLLEADDPDLRARVAKHLRRTSGKHVLFIFDGFDELNEEEQPLFLKFLQGDLLHMCSIILTSRSYAIEDIKYEEWIHRHVEVLGFTEEQIESYIMQNIPDKSKANTLGTSMKEKMSLTSVSYTPLNCSILLYIFQLGKYKLPSSLTELFESFVFSLLKRHSKKFNTVFSKMPHRSLISLPYPLSQQFSALCKLAYHGMIEGKFVFSHQNVRKAFTPRYRDVFEQSMESSLLSLLISTTSFYCVGEEQHYQFLHVTIQEYLAAKYLASQPGVDQRRFLSNSWTSPRMRAMLVFYAGITGLEGTTSNNFFIRVCSHGYLNTILCRQAGQLVPYDHLQSLQNDSDPHSQYPSMTGISEPRHQPTSQWGNYVTQKTALSDVPVVFRDDSSRWGGHSTDQKTALSDVPLAFRDSASKRGGLSVKAALLSISKKYAPNTKPPVPVATQGFLNLASMLTEANNPSLVKLFFGYEQPIHTIQVGYCRLTAVDCLAIAKILSNCQHSLQSLRFSFCNLTHQSLEIFHKISSTMQCCLEECNEVQLNYCAPSVSSALYLIPQIPWFQHTKVLHLLGLQYPKSCLHERFQLHSVLKLESLTDLTVTVEHIPSVHFLDYESVLLNFIEALSGNKTLKRLTYNQAPPATCESFVELMTALSHTSMLLTLGHTSIITDNAVTIPDDICFSICLQGSTSAKTLADARNIRNVQIHQQNLLLLCHSCECYTISKPKSSNKGDPTESYCFNYSTDIGNQFNLQVDYDTSTWTESKQHSNKVRFEHCTPRILSSLIPILPQIPWLNHIKELHLSGLQYPTRLQPEGFQLHSVLKLESLTDLTVTVEYIPSVHFLDYESVLLNFIEALSGNKTLKRLTYNQAPPAICESFVELMTALSHTSMLLTLGHTSIITDNAVTIPDDICFSICLQGLTSAKALADARKIKNVQIHQQNLLLLCHSCECSTIPKPKSSSKGDPTESYCFNCSTDIGNQFSLQVDYDTSTLTESKQHSNKVLFEHCTPILSSLIPILLQIPWLNHIKELRLSGLQYPTRLQPEGFQLHSVLKLESLTDLTVTVEYIPSDSFLHYESVLLKFFEALPRHQTLERLTYNQAPPATCESFVELMTALSHTSTLLTLGNTDVVTVDSIVIPNDICFKFCSKGLASVMMLADKRCSRSMLIRQYDLFLPTESRIVAIPDHPHYPAALPVELDSSLLAFSGTRCSHAEDSGNLLASWVAKNKSLKMFDIAGCNATDMVAKRVAEGLAQNKTLEMFDMVSPLLTSEGAVHILKSIKQSETLTGLNLFGALLTVSYNPYCLKVSEISTTCISAIVNVLEALLHVTDVEELVIRPVSIDDMSEDFGYGLEKMLSTNETLRKLQLSECGLNINDAVANQIAVGLAKNHSLETLNLSSNYNITSAGAVLILKALESNCSLKEIDLTGLPFINIRPRQPSAKDSSEPLGCAIENMLGLNQTLRNLYVSCCQLDDSVAPHIATGLARNCTLKLLDLSDNNITSAGAVHIFKSLESNSSLEDLSLSFNSFPQWQVSTKSEDESFGHVMERMLTVNLTLTSIHLQCSKLCDPIAVHIANGLAKNNSVKILNLTNNYFTIAGAVLILKSLENNTALEQLHLTDLVSNGDCTDEFKSLGCVLEKMLAANLTLRNLNLRGCRINDSIARHISIGLTKCTLKVLNLSNNLITGAGVPNIFSSLESNTNLEELDLSCNDLQLWETSARESLGCVIETMLIFNQTLKTLNLNDCKLNDEIAVHIANGLDKNHSLKVLSLRSYFSQERKLHISLPQ